MTHDVRTTAYDFNVAQQYQVLGNNPYRYGISIVNPWPALLFLCKQFATTHDDSQFLVDINSGLELWKHDLGSMICNEWWLISETPSLTITVSEFFWIP